MDRYYNPATGITYKTRLQSIFNNDDTTREYNEKTERAWGEKIEGVAKKFNLTEYEVYEFQDQLENTYNRMPAYVYVPSLELYIEIRLKEKRNIIE